MQFRAGAYPSIALILVVAASPAPLRAQGGMTGATSRTGSKPAMGAPGLVPFGVMTGQAGQWMVGYQYMLEELRGLLDGTNSVSEADVLARFQTTPTDMKMQVHMGMMMYAPTARLTLTAMLPYVSMSMGELHRDGIRSTERSSGIGDLALRGLYSLYATKDRRHQFLANAGVGLPTGSIDRPDADGARLEYPMQTGSGTFSMLPGLMYLGRTSSWGWGATVDATVRLGSNAHGYRLGNRYAPQAWVARQLTKSVSLSAGVGDEWWDNIHGTDALLDPADEPTKDADLQGGSRVDAWAGVTLSPASGFLKGQQFLVQADVPVTQSLNGPQLQRSYMLHLAWQLGF